jgi:hypothetical protein
MIIIENITLSPDELNIKRIKKKKSAGKLARGSSRGTRKLARTPTVTKKKKKEEKEVITWFYGN